MSAPEVKPVPVDDAAGLDKLLLATFKGCAFWCQERLAQSGIALNLWDGKDGLGAVIEERLKAAGVPNKRLPELLTPRATLDRAGVKVVCKRVRVRGRVR